jgi:hypothetical protein
MHNLYLIGASFIGIIILIKYFARATENNTENQNLDEFELSDECHVVSDESSLEKSIQELDKSNNSTTVLNNEQIKTVEITKNKFLYPDDEFGKMERGVQFKNQN